MAAACFCLGLSSHLPGWETTTASGFLRRGQYKLCSQLPAHQGLNLVLTQVWDSWEASGTRFLFHESPGRNSDVDLAAFYCFAVGWPPAVRGKIGGRDRGGGAVTKHERRRKAWGQGSTARGTARAGPAAAWAQGAETRVWEGERKK